MQKIPLAVIAALDDEIKIIVSKMETDEKVHFKPALFTRGKYGKKQVLICRSGIGRDAMEKAMGFCLSTWRPELCLHVGYCGGCDPSLAAGDLVAASAVADARTADRIECDSGLVARAHRMIAEHKLRGRSGSIVTIDELIPSPHEKAFIGTKYEAVALDMESVSVAAACRAAGVPLLIVRAVLDPLDHALPDFGDALDESGHTDGLALAGHLARHPYDALKLPHLEYFASQARNAISAFVDAWIMEAL